VTISQVEISHLQKLNIVFFWLINFLFSDEISATFICLGDKKDKNVLDSGLAANAEYFW
jgi:hypothetical protein